MTLRTRARSTLTAALVLVTLAGIALPAAATSEPSSDLLLPWFEVHLTGSRTTLFALGNAAGEAVDVRVAVHTNWGIPVVERTISLGGGEVTTVNLRDWVVTGDVPVPKLRGAGLAHLRAALTGQPSPKDDLFYATQSDPFDPELATGYVTFRVQGAPRLNALWGDYFWVDPAQDFAEGELLVNIDRSSSCGDLCDLRRMRFLDGGGFDGGTKLIVWSPKRLTPAPDANAATARNLLTLSAFHEEPGSEFDERVMELLPVQLVEIRELVLAEKFGWLDMASDDEIYVGVRYSASHRYSVTMQTWCLPDPPPPPNPPITGGPAAIDVEKSTNGEDADVPGGPQVAANGPVTWEYVVTNTGDVALSDVEVTDDQEGPVPCPASSLEPGESMTCTLTGSAPPPAAEDFHYANLATATGRPAQGPEVSDSDPSHYWVPGQGIEPPPPPPECGDCEGKVTRLTFRYLGAIPGAHVQVIAKRGPSSPIVFDGTVSPGGTFEVVGPAGGGGGFSGTLGTEIRILVGGIENAVIHTSCSQPVGPGLVSGDFEVLEGASSGGGLLCPLG